MKTALIALAALAALSIAALLPLSSSGAVGICDPQHSALCSGLVEVWSFDEAISDGDRVGSYGNGKTIVGVFEDSKAGVLITMIDGKPTISVIESETDALSGYAAASAVSANAWHLVVGPRRVVPFSLSHGVGLVLGLVMRGGAVSVWRRWG